MAIINEWRQYKEGGKLNQKLTHKLRAIIINGVEYKSPKEASDILGIEYATLIYRINSDTIKSHLQGPRIIINRPSIFFQEHVTTQAYHLSVIAVGRIIKFT